jgi:hypothetical protein
MARPIHLELLTDFFNKIDPEPLIRPLHACVCGDNHIEGSPTRPLLTFEPSNLRQSLVGPIARRASLRVTSFTPLPSTR